MISTLPDLTTSRPTRRTVLKGAAYAAAAAAGSSMLRGFDAEAAAAPAHRGVFGYGVASGDPTGDSLIIWTRATPPPQNPGDPVATPGSGLGRRLRVHWQVAYDRGFRRVARQGTVRTSPDSDHTVKVDVRGLRPYTRYWYRFVAEGETSPVGRTQTAPDEPRREHALRFALVSCSNYTGGWFTAYRAISRRRDLDFVLHVGDYIYEFGNGSDRSGPAALVGKRDALPTTETIDLEGYRLRHALHKADPDLQRAHARHPWITMFDDHEVANNTWARGAQNHTPGDLPGGEGDFLARRRAAYEAYLEWMPFRLPEQRSVPHQGTRFFKRFRFGRLADLSVIETRQNRSAQVGGTFAGLPDGFVPLSPDLLPALTDPTRHLPEPEQLDWLSDGLARRGKRWHLVGNQVVFTPLRFPGVAFNVPQVPVLINADQWDGYQADQAALVGHLGAQPAAHGDAVFLTGDIHSSWVSDIPDSAADPKTSVGVEIVCPSVTSDGFYELLARAARGTKTPKELVATVGQLVGAVQKINPWVRYLDGVGHGFVVVDVTADRVQADYHLTPVPTSALPDPRVDPDVEPAYATSWQTVHGSRRTSAASGPLGRRLDHPYERRRHV